MVAKLDFVGIPSRDPERSRAYVDTLGLRLILQHRYAPYGD